LVFDYRKEEAQKSAFFLPIIKIMSIETKKVVCSPSDENALINHYTKFGWVLAHRDEVYSQTEHVIGAKTYSLALTDDFAVGHTDVSSYTSTTNYVNILFQRDSLIPGYDQLAVWDNQCENDFKEIQNIENNRERQAVAARDSGSNSRVTAITVLFILGFLLTAGGCAMALGEGTHVGGLVTAIIGLLLFIAGCFVGLYGVIHASKGQAAYSNIMNASSFKSRLTEIRADIATLEKQGSDLQDSFRLQASSASPAPSPILVEAESHDKEEASPLLEAPQEEASAKEEPAPKATLSHEDILKSINQAIGEGKVDLASGKAIRAHEKGLLSEEEYASIKQEIDELRSL
jgi:hypothetical protein